MYIAGVRCPAMRVKGCAYTIAVVKKGVTSYRGAGSVSSALQIMLDDAEINKIVVYKYHPKLGKFEKVRVFARGGDGTIINERIQKHTML